MSIQVPPEKDIKNRLVKSSKLKKEERKEALFLMKFRGWHAKIMHGKIVYYENFFHVSAEFTKEITHSRNCIIGPV